jgi:hypothetical protein
MLFTAIRIFKKLITKEHTLEKIISTIKTKLFIKYPPVGKIYRHLLKRKLTFTTSRSDGFGRQYLAMVCGIAWCEFMHYKYIHTSFQKSLDGTYSNVDEFNNFVGIPVERKMQDFSGKAHITKKNENVDAIIGLEADKIFENLRWMPDKFFTKKLLKKLKNYYYSTPKPTTKKYDIAIHIRRGNIIPSKCSIWRLIPNKNYVALIKFFRKKHPTYSICIYSEGKIEDFQDLQMPGIAFDLNTGTTAIFHSFVQAKILVTAKSAFSYTAALLSDNIIYSMPYLYSPLKHWKMIPNNIFGK